jgi:acetylornithine deacetylase/succinyl-diaminopimelate desuccinylase-like protein
MSASKSLPAVLSHIDSKLDENIERLFDFLRIPSISTDQKWKADCAKAADWLKKDLSTIGFKTNVRPTKGHPVVVAHSMEKSKTKARPHVLFYGHYDVQPVDPLEQWTSPPFEPKLVEIAKSRKVIVARGACDDKGQVMTFIEACRAWKAVTGSLPIDITVMIEGEEENGSINLPEFVKANAKELKADMALVCDTGMWDRKTPAITTSLRGLLYEEIIIRAADRDLHSGLFGGAAANPIHILSSIINSL